MIETVFDTLNCKAAIYAIEEVYEEMGLRLPVWISAPSPTCRAGTADRPDADPPSGIRCAMPIPSPSA